MEDLNKDKKYSVDESNNFDNLIPDSYISVGKDYPIIERKNNALLWPEKIKDGIDINDNYADTITQVEVNPNSHLQSIKK